MFPFASACLRSKGVPACENVRITGESEAIAMLSAERRAQILATVDQKTLQHDPDDAAFPGRYLLGNRRANRRLAPVRAGDSAVPVAGPLGARPS